MTRGQLLALPDDVAAELASQPEIAGLPRFFGHALVLRTFRYHVLVTQLSAGDARRLDVWLGEAGVVAHPQQPAADVPAPVIGSAHTDAPMIWAGAVCPRPRPAAGQVHNATTAELGDAAHSLGSDRVAIVVDVSDRESGTTRRLVSYEADGVRWAGFDVGGLDDPVEFVPATAVAVLGWIVSATPISVSIPTPGDDDPAEHDGDRWTG